MKFFDCATAPSPRRVRVFLAEKGVDLPVQQIDLASGEQFSKEFRAINPDCTVPALQLDDGSCISEVIAICDYIERRYPDKPMMGRNDEQRAEVLMWNARIEWQGLHALADLLRNSSKAMANRALPGPGNYAQIPELAERGRLRAEDFFNRLNAHLDGRDFIAGDDYSMADITALVTADFARWSKINAADGRPNLARWYEAASNRPASGI